MTRTIVWFALSSFFRWCQQEVHHYRVLRATLICCRSFRSSKVLLDNVCCQNQKIRKTKSFLLFCKTATRSTSLCLSHHRQDWSSTQEVKLPEDLTRTDHLRGNWSSFSKTLKKLAGFLGIKTETALGSFETFFDANRKYTEKPRWSEGRSATRSTTGTVLLQKSHTFLYLPPWVSIRILFFVIRRQRRHHLPWLIVWQHQSH